MTLEISTERWVLLALVQQSWEVLSAKAPLPHSRRQFLSIPLPGLQEHGLVSSKGREDGILFSSSSVLGLLASHSKGELLGCGNSKLL